MRLALKLSIDPRNLIRQPLFGVFLTDWAKPKINGHAAVVFVDDASTVTIDPDTGCTCACHDVPPRLKAEIVGTVMHERKRKGVRRRSHATSECRFAPQPTSLPQRCLRKVSQMLVAVAEPPHINAE
jgi:hypothetical protein